MKKILLGLLFIAVSVSCSGDEETQELPLRANLVGKWYFDSSAKGDDVVPYDNLCSTYRDGVEFLDNGSLVTSKGASDCSVNTDGTGTWSLDDYKLQVTAFDPVVYLNGSFRIQQLSQFNMTLLQKVTPPSGSTYNVYYYLVKN